jgi:hypothetical protein
MQHSNGKVKWTIGNVGNALSCRVTTTDFLGGQIQREEDGY